MCTKSLHLEGIFHILFTSEGPGHIPLRHPLTKAVYPSNCENTKLLKKNEQEVHLFSLQKNKNKTKQKQTNKQNRYI